MNSISFSLASFQLFEFQLIPDSFADLAMAATKSAKGKAAASSASKCAWIPPCSPCSCPFSCVSYQQKTLRLNRPKKPHSRALTPMPPVNPVSASPSTDQRPFACPGIPNIPGRACLMPHGWTSSGQSSGGVDAFQSLG